MEAQLLTQLYNAIVVGVIAIVGALVTFIVAVFRWLPQYMKARQDQYTANEDTRREISKEQSDTNRENEQAENRVKIAQAIVFEAQAEMLKSIIKEFKEGRDTTEAHTIAVTNQTHAVDANGRQITGLTEAIGELREKINEAVDKIPKNAAQIETSITTLSDIAQNITAAQVDLNLLFNKVNVMLTLKKGDSKPMPPVTPEMLDTSTDGKPCD